MGRQLNQAGIDLIIDCEGFSPDIYDDVGHPAIGFGHDILPGEHFDPPITREQAIELFTKDCTWRERRVEQLVNADITDNQFAALVSLFYNIGESNFTNSTVLRKLNQEDYDGAAEAFKMWHFVRKNGVLVSSQDLVERREKEINLFQTED